MMIWPDLRGVARLDEGLKGQEMEMSISRRLLAGLAVILAVGACENDMEPGEELTVEESVALLTGMGQEMQVMLSDTTIVPIHVSADSVVVACPQGGRAKLILAEPEDTTRLEVNVQVTPTGCVVTGGGQQFTVDGDPNFVYMLSVEITASFEVNISGAITGGLGWALGERSGGCDIALTLDAMPDLTDPSNPGLTGTYNGTLCGHEVEIDAAALVALEL